MGRHCTSAKYAMTGKCYETGCMQRSTSDTQSKLQKAREEHLEKEQITGDKKHSPRPILKSEKPILKSEKPILKNEKPILKNEKLIGDKKHSPMPV